jgi:hypothetical protein
MDPIQWSSITRVPYQSHHRDSQRWVSDNKCTDWLWYRLRGFSLPVRPRQCQLRDCADETPGQKIHPPGFFIIIHTRTGSKDTCVFQSTLAMVVWLDIIHTVLPPCVNLLRYHFVQHINRFLFLAEDGLAAFKVVVSSLPLTPSGFPDRWWWWAGGEGPSSPNAPRPYKQALCAPLKVISFLIHL